MASSKVDWAVIAKVAEVGMEIGPIVFEAVGNFIAVFAGEKYTPEQIEAKIAPFLDDSQRARLHEALRGSIPEARARLDAILGPMDSDVT